MKVNINSEESLAELARAVNSKQGQLILSYLQSEFDKISYNDIPTDIPYNEIGQWFIITRSIKDKLKSVISFLTRNYN